MRCSILATSLLALGCYGQDTPAPQCEGSCDELAPTASPLASCWIVPGERVDSTFDSDELHCTRHADAAGGIDVAQLNIALSKGQDQSLRFLFSESLAMAESTFVGRFFTADYPVDLEFSVHYGTGNSDIIGASGLRVTRQHFHIRSTDDGTAEEPLRATLPFQVWEVDLLNQSPEAVGLHFNHSIPLEAESDPLEVQGSIHVTEFGLRSRRSVIVPLDHPPSAKVEFNATGVTETAAVAGPGSYEINALGQLVALQAADMAEPTGAETALCWPEQTITPAAEDCVPAQDLSCEPTTKNEIVCMTTLDPRVGTVSATISPQQTPPFVLALTEGETRIEVGEQELDFPLQIDVETSIESSVRGLAQLGAARVHSSAMALATPTSEAVGATLPFKVLDLSIGQSQEVLLFAITLHSFDTPLGYHWGERFAVRTQSEPIDLDFAGEIDLLIAVAPDTESLLGTATAVDMEGNIVTDMQVEIASGRWIAEMRGVVPAP